MEQQAQASRKIAVLAVHGVADQAPGVTARQTAGLLLGQNLAQQYGTFREEQLLIGLRSVELAKQLELKADSIWDFPPQQSSNVSQGVYYNQPIRYTDGSQQNPADMQDADLEHESMREQLQGFDDSAGDNYLETIVLRSQHPPEEHTDCGVDVDIYECYWADLSRLKNGFFTVFFEFYLFLFFFSRIGGIAVEHAVAHYNGDPAWKRLQTIHWISETALVLGVPLTHMTLLSLAVNGAPFLLIYLFPNASISTLFLTSIAAMAAAFGIVSGYFIGRKQASHWWPVLFGVIIGIAWLAVTASKPLATDIRAFVFLLWVVMAIAMLLLCYIYNQRRPGALLFGSVFFAITGITFLLFLYTNNDGSMQAVFLRGVEATRWLVGMNIVMWLIFVFGTLFASIAGWQAAKALHGHEKQLAQRTAWTQALSLVLPGLMIMLITFALWQALFRLSQPVIGDPTLIAAFQTLIDSNIFPHLSLGLCVMGLGMAFAMWIVSPAPLCEGIKPNDRRIKAKWVGETLTDAYNKMRWVGELLRFMLLIGIPLEWFYLIYLQLSGMQPPAEELALHRNIIFYAGIGVFILIFGSKGPFSFLAIGFHSGLDIALDVANWLRFRPQENNPRATICRRYASILRHIAQWRDPVNNKGYDELVIVAHSQGTVITADLLRFLKREYASTKVQESDPSLAHFFASEAERLPISLLTFGSPLRQLYNQRFPFQYHWAGSRTGLDTEVGKFRHGPAPEMLGVERWSNLYCSGDYVGRYLWYDHTDPHIWELDWSCDTKTASCYPNTREKCLGVGAHTKYWSGTFPAVAEELDHLIRHTRR